MTVSDSISQQTKLWVLKDNLNSKFTKSNVEIRISIIRRGVWIFNFNIWMLDNSKYIISFNKALNNILSHFEWLLFSDRFVYKIIRKLSKISVLIFHKRLLAEFQIFHRFSHQFFSLNFPKTFFFKKNW